ncbi:WD40-repeat-containing domain protein [Cladochytrium replicatum]|nr:WD40-repeat-containing domain protein [Cladochytrium replicatum]
MPNSPSLTSDSMDWQPTRQEPSASFEIASFREIYTTTESLVSLVSERALKLDIDESGLHVKDTSPKFIDSLADEIICHIFEYLGSHEGTLASCAVVNKRWARVMRDNYLWRNLCRVRGFEPIVVVVAPASTIVTPATTNESQNAEINDANVMEIESRSHRSGAVLRDRRRQRRRIAARKASVSPSSRSHSRASSSGKSERPHIHHARSTTGSLIVTRNGYHNFRFPLAPWKKVFKDNYLTHQNWKIGKYVVRNINQIRNSTNGQLYLNFDDRWVVSISLGDVGRMWDMHTGEIRFRFSGHNGIITAVKFDQRYRFVVSGGVDGVIKVWYAGDELSLRSCSQSADSQNNQLSPGQCILTCVGHTDEIVCLQHNDDTIVSGSEDKTVRIWKISSGECTAVLRGHTGAVCCVYHHENVVVSGSTDTLIKLWCVIDLKLNKNGFLTPGCRDIRTAKCLKTLRGHVGHVYCLQYDHARNFVISGAQDTTIKIWNLSASRGQQTCVRTLTGHELGVVCLQFDKHKIVSGSADKTIRVWDINTGRCLYTLVQHSGSIWNLRFTKTKLISSSFDQTLLVWDFAVMEEESDNEDIEEEAGRIVAITNH